MQTNEIEALLNASAWLVREGERYEALVERIHDAWADEVYPTHKCATEALVLEPARAALRAAAGAAPQAEG